MKSEQELGYHSEGEPTDAQLQLQDEIDSAVQGLFNKMREIYRYASGIDIPKIEHDIHKLTQVRELVEELINASLNMYSNA